MDIWTQRIIAAVGVVVFVWMLFWDDERYMYRFFVDDVAIAGKVVIFLGVLGGIVYILLSLFPFCKKLGGIFKDSFQKKTKKKSVNGKSSKEGSLDYANDDPVCNEKKDRLKRTPVLNKMAKLLEDRNYIVHIDGAWGSGKTSVASMLKKRINKWDKSDSSTRHIIINFNPWAYSSEKSLTVAFFEAIGAGTNDKIVRQLIAALTGLNSGVGKIVEFFYGRKSLEELKKEFVRSLKERGEKLYIFIDDIDRLQEKKRIHEVLRIIGQWKGKDNICFVLMFSLEETSKSLDLDDTKFFEKFYDKSFPLINTESQITGYIDECIKKITGKERESKEARKVREAIRRVTSSDVYYGDVYDFKDLRSAKKFLHIFESNFMLFGKDVVHRDIEYVSLLQARYPKAYEKLPEIEHSLESDDKPEEIKKILYEEYCDSENKENVNRSCRILKSILDSLFSYLTEGMPAKNTAELSRFADVEIFRKWFIGEKPLEWDSLSYKEGIFDNFIDLSKEDKKEAVNEERFLDFVADYARKEFFASEKEVDKIRNIHSVIESVVYWSQLEVGSDFLKNICEYAYHYNKHIYLKEIKETVRKALQKTENVHFVLQVVYNLTVFGGSYNDKFFKDLHEDGSIGKLQDLMKILCKLLKKDTISDNEKIHLIGIFNNEADSFDCKSICKYHKFICNHINIQIKKERGDNVLTKRYKNLISILNKRCVNYNK